MNRDQLIILIYCIIFISLVLVSCENEKNKNEEIVRKYIELSNKGDTAELKKLLSDDFNKATILLKKDFSEKSIKIEKEILVIDELNIIDKNKIKTVEHLEDIYSDFFKLEMPKYEITYFIANSKIKSINLNFEKAIKKENLRKKIRHMEIETSFSNWFTENYSKYNNRDSLVENGILEYLKVYSKLDSIELKKYEVKYN